MIIPMRTTNNKTIFIEVDGPEDNSSTVHAQGLVDGLEDIKSPMMAADICQTIEDFTGEVFSKLKSLSDTTTISFGVAVSSEMGIPIIAKGKAEANVSVSLTWETAETKSDYPPQVKGEI